MRERVSIEKVLEIVTAFKESGLTAPEYCRRNEMDVIRLRGYIKRSRKFLNKSEAALSGFTRIEPTGHPVTELSGIEIRYGQFRINLTPGFSEPDLMKVFRAIRGQGKHLDV